MASDYATIKAENERRYGTDIGRIGPMLLADRYDDRSHFIYELLQNAEDALARRSYSSGQNSVRFHLTDKELRVSHFGEPFNEADVRGICGIAESTKELNAIGRFGIGFKSVYAFTDSPRVHSGSEDFAINSFVWPAAAPPTQRSDQETVIVIPLKSETAADHKDIAAGLQRLGARTLLFLRHVEEIEWVVDGGPSGLYLRSQPEMLLDDVVRRVTLLGQAKDEPDIEESWLVFARGLSTEDGNPAGYVEMAFKVGKDEKLGRETVCRVRQSRLVVFFPTVLETHLGFLLQGPYRTTPSRDNVPRHDEWNQRCVHDTGHLLADALRWLRDNELLDADALRSLPLDKAKFGDDAMFAPLFEATKHLLSSEALLPRAGGGYQSASSSKLARTQELRELFDAPRLTALFESERALAWLSGEISQDRTPELRQYLMRELDVPEVTPETILSRLSDEFLAAQPHEWILKLYEFLNGQSALRQRALALPLVRLTDGTHVPAFENEQPSAFLPSEIETGFPTVNPAVCRSEDAQKFLTSLGLTAPDPVDDVVWNVLPKYREEEVDVTDDAYDADIRRILVAFASDSKVQRDKLLSALRETPFVMVVDAGDDKEFVAKPGEIYLATERLKTLFSGVDGVLLVDDRYSCLRGESVRELLEACGAVRQLRLSPVGASFGWGELRDMRVAAGCESMSSSEPLEDNTILGLDPLLAYLRQLDPADRQERACHLWDALVELESRRGAGVFSGSYSWFYYHRRTTTFDAEFVRTLNAVPWIPDADGDLREPSVVVFDSLDWKPNPFLLSKIHFKPPVVDQLAREAGFEPAVLDLLKRRGITSEAQLRALLGVEDEPSDDDDESGNVDNALEKLLGEAPNPTPPVPDPANEDPAPAEDSGGGSRRSARAASNGRKPTGAGSRKSRGREKGTSRSKGKRSPGSTGGRPFISYVAAHHDDEGPDPDGLAQPARMALEAKAIEFILSREPQWKGAPAFNPGFDLFQVGADGQPCLWCEVKAMTGGLRERPVGLSKPQYDCASAHGEDYWIYVVEHAGNEHARVVRIQDPAGKARTFTFDRGWLDVAEVDSEMRGD